MTFAFAFALESSEAFAFTFNCVGMHLFTSLLLIQRLSLTLAVRPLPLGRTLTFALAVLHSGCAAIFARDSRTRIGRNDSCCWCSGCRRRFRCSCCFFCSQQLLHTNLIIIHREYVCLYVYMFGRQTFIGSSTTLGPGRLSLTFFEIHFAITLSTNNRNTICSYYGQLYATVYKGKASLHIEL